MISKDGSTAIRIDEETKKNYLWIQTKNFYKDFIIIRRSLQENSGVPQVIRDFVGVHRKSLQSIRQRITVNFSTYVR